MKTAGRIKGLCCSDSEHPQKLFLYHIVGFIHEETIHIISDIRDEIILPFIFFEFPKVMEIF